MGIADRIAQEIKDKFDDYETRQSNFMSDYNEWADIFRVKRPNKTTGIKGYSNPRLTEMFRAVNALATMEVRMMTSQDPYFELVPYHYTVDPGTISIIEAVLDQQLRVSEHKRHLLRACTSKELFGTVIVEEPWEVVGINPYGRRLPLTAFRPRSMLQVAFDLNTSDIDRAAWLATSDVVGPHTLRRMHEDTKEHGGWIKSALNAAVEDQQEVTTSSFVASRLSSAGYNTLNEQKNARELITYHGKLETLNDGVEYVASLVNREHLVRFFPNRFQHGRRGFRVARWVEFELEPLALGLGQLLGRHHKSMDANRKRVQDLVAFDTYGMWIIDRLAGIQQNALAIKPMGTIEADNINALRRLDSGGVATNSGLKLEEILQNEFRTTSGATSSLQAIVTAATASEVSLAQNEAVRNISVKAELAADSLVRQHLEVMHFNNIELIREPLRINVDGRPTLAYPSDLWADVDFRAKVTTDKDFRPERMKKIIEVVQILTSIRNAHPDKYDINLIPWIMELARGIGGINPKDIIRVRSEQERMALAAQAGMGAGGGQGAPPPSPVPPEAMPGELPDLPGGMGQEQTFVGPVLASPGGSA